MKSSSIPTYPLWAGSLAHTQLGPLSVVVSSEGLRRVVFAPASQLAAELAGRLGCTEDAPAWLGNTLQELQSYLNGCCRLFTTPVDWRGLSAFEESVLRATLSVAFGETSTYGEIARAIGRPQAARAVGVALARNPMPLVIPCHRVVDSLGHLHGYSAPGGTETKAWLLHLEGMTLIGQRLA